MVGADHPEFGKGTGIWGDGGEPDNVVFLPTGATRRPDIRILDAANMSGTKARQLVKLKQDADFYGSIGFDKGNISDAARAVYERISAWLPRSEARKMMNRGEKNADTREHGHKGGGGDEDTVYSADAEFVYPNGGRRRKTRRRRRTRKTRRNRAGY